MSHSDLVPQPGNFLLYLLSALLLVIVVLMTTTSGFQLAFIPFALLPAFTATLLFIKFIAFFIRQLNPGIFSFRLTATFYPHFHIGFVSNTHIIGNHELGHVVTSSDGQYEIHLEPIQRPPRIATRPDPRTTPAVPVSDPPGRRRSQHTARPLRFPPNTAPFQQIGLLATRIREATERQQQLLHAGSNHPFTRATIGSYIDHDHPYNNEAIQMAWAQEYAQLGQELDWVDGLPRVIRVVSGEPMA